MTEANLPTAVPAPLPVATPVISIPKYEYKVVLYREGALGSIFLAGSKVNPLKFSEFLNKNAALGWKVVTMQRESRRLLLFFSREAFLVVMERQKQEGGTDVQSA